MVTLMDAPHAVITLPPISGPPVVVLHSVDFLSAYSKMVDEVDVHVQMTSCEHDALKNQSDNPQQKLYIFVTYSNLYML